MKTLKAAVLALLMSGCATTQLGRTDSNMQALRSRDGACAGGGGRQMCARIGQPGTLRDDGVTPTVVVTLKDWTIPLANTGNWQLTVTAPDGSRLYQGILRDQVPNLGACINTGCLKWSVDVVPMPVKWVPGKYQFDLVCAFDTTMTHHAELVLHP